MPGGNVSMPEVDPPRLRFGASAADWILCGVAVALFAVTAIRLLSVSLVLWLNSDAAVPVLLADEILREGSLFPSTWHYANGEIWTLAAQIFALPFVLVLGVCLPALKLANMTALVFAIASVALMVRYMTRSSAFALIVALGVLAPFSSDHIGVVYVQAAYGLVLGQLALLIYLSLRILDRGEERRRVAKWIWIAYPTLLIQFAVGSPLRAFVYWMLPLAAACIVTLRFWKWQDIARLFVVSIAVLLAGAALHEVMRAHLQVAAGVSTLRSHSVEDWLPAAQKLWEGASGFLDYGSFLPFEAAPAFGASRWARAIFLGLALAASLLTLRPSRSDSPTSVFFAALAAAMFVAVLGIIVVIDLPIGRYLLPSLLLCLSALMTTLRLRLRAHALVSTIVTAVFVVAFCGGASLRAFALPRAPQGGTCDAPNLICSLRSALEQRDLDKGYATYWEANVTTLASHGEIKVCGVTAGTRIRPFRWLVSEHCFDPPAESDRYFVAFRRAEAARIDRDAYIADLGRPDSTFEVSDYEIWIYEPGMHRTDWLRR
jgi:hypothetical protein